MSRPGVRVKDRKADQGPKQRSGNGRNTRAWLLSGALVLGMVLAAVAGFLFFSQLLSASLSSGASGSLDRKSVGAESAPVTVVVYSDFQ